MRYIMSDSDSLKPIKTNAAPGAIGPYSQGIVSQGRLLFISGQLPIDPKTNELVTGDIKAATEQILKNIQAIADAAGAGLDQVVKTTVFLKDMGQFQDMNHVYAQYLGHVMPARSAIQVAALPKEAEIEIEAIVNLGS